MEMTNKELSTRIRNELKAAGIDRKAYRIRVRDAGYETSINIDVTDVSINLDRVWNVVGKYKAVDRDDRTFEILAGGNTFVFVRYDYDAMEAASAPYMKQATELFNNPDVPLWEEYLVATHRRNGHECELIWFKGDNYMTTRKKGSLSSGNIRHYAGSPSSIANAMALFGEFGSFPGRCLV